MFLRRFKQNEQAPIVLRDDFDDIPFLILLFSSSLFYFSCSLRSFSRQMICTLVLTSAFAFGRTQTKTSVIGVLSI